MRQQIANLVDDFIRQQTTQFATSDVITYIWEHAKNTDPRKLPGTVSAKLSYMCKHNYLKRLFKGIYVRVIDPPRPPNEIPKLPSNGTLTAIQVGEGVIAKITELTAQLKECIADNKKLVATNTELIERNTKLKETINEFYKPHAARLDSKTFEPKED